jgi:hypothetical protein
MNKLWVFGDSFSEPFSKAKRLLWKTEYIQWKGYTPKCYGEIISEKYNLLHLNIAIGGTDNYTILDSIIDVLTSIATGDIIIIGWTNTSRFRVINNNNSFNTIRPSSFKKLSGVSQTNLSESTLIELLVNRDSLRYIDELNNYIKLINFSFPNNKIIHWSPFSQDENGLNTMLTSSTKYETISEETNGLVNDYHYGENGHLEIAKNIINAIDDYEAPKFKTNLL